MVMKRGRRRVLLECEYRPAQMVLIVERERERDPGSMAFRSAQYKYFIRFASCHFGLSSVFMIFSILIKN